jgi:hypothetical protein
MGNISNTSPFFLPADAAGTDTALKSSLNLSTYGPVIKYALFLLAFSTAYLNASIHNMSTNKHS